MTVEDAKSLQQNILWQELCLEIDTLVNSSLSRLAICSPAELIPLQERIKSLVGLKNLPQDIVDRQT